MTKSTYGLRNIVSGVITDREFRALEREAEALCLSRSAMVRQCIAYYFAPNPTTKCKKAS